MSIETLKEKYPYAVCKDACGFWRRPIHPVFEHLASIKTCLENNKLYPNLPLVAPIWEMRMNCLINMPPLATVEVRKCT